MDTTTVMGREVERSLPNGVCGGVSREAACPAAVFPETSSKNFYHSMIEKLASCMPASGHGRASSPGGLKCPPPILSCRHND